MGFVGIIVVFATVFGGFIIAGGHMSVIIKSAPIELLIIGGGGLRCLFDRESDESY